MQITISPTMEEATRALVENLLASEPFVGYQQAQERLNADGEARQLLQDLSVMQSKLRRQETTSPLSQSDIQRLRQLQQQVQENPVIANFAQTQQAAVDLLRQVNVEISQLLGIDFAAFAKRSPCC